VLGSCLGVLEVAGGGGGEGGGGGREWVREWSCEEEDEVWLIFF